MTGNPKGIGPRGPRQSAALALAVLLAACSFGETPEQGTIGFVEGYLGGIAADEPRAATVGRDVLSAGGNAVDAAVATFFALSVTMPSAAGLGGGGVCLVHDRASKRVEALEFVARPPAAPRPGATLANAVPSNVRGFFALHARYGRLRWGEVLSPAENLARFGEQVSRATAAEFDKGAQALAADPEARRVFGGRDGAMPSEGGFLKQLDLAAIISNLRIKGAGDLYNGNLGQTLVGAVSAMGGSLTLDDLRAVRPEWRPTLSAPFGNLTVHFAPPPAEGGMVAGQMWAMLEAGDRFEDAGTAERAHLLAETASRAFASRAAFHQGWKEGNLPAMSEQRIADLMAGYSAARHAPSAGYSPPPQAVREDASGTGFIVFDNEGSAVACETTMGGPFGTGRMVPGTGMLVAVAPNGAAPAVSLGPVMAVNQHVNEFHFAAVGAGGVAAPTSNVNVAAWSLLAGKPVAEAVAAKRVHHGGMPDVTFYEDGLDKAAVDQLVAAGHKIQPVQRIGRVNAARCPKGMPAEPDLCQVASDPRGFGLGLAGR